MIALCRLLVLLFSFDGVMTRATYALVSLICVVGCLELFLIAWPTAAPHALLNDAASPYGDGLIGYWSFRPLLPALLLWLFSAASYKRLKQVNLRDTWLLAPLLIFIASMILVAFPRALDETAQHIATLVFTMSACALVSVWIILLNAPDRADRGGRGA